MRFANRTVNLYEESHDLIDMMRQVDMPDMINFSGGFPSPEGYPIFDIKTAMIEVLRKDAKAALSYGSTVGIDSLREHISERMNDKFSLKTQKDEIIILSGSQQGLDLSGLLFINPGDVVIFEKPSYLGALNAMKPYEAKLIGVNMDDDGLNLEELKKVLDSYGDKVKVIYVNPDHQNPTGRSWSKKRREDFIELVEGYDVAVLEDGAYGEISYTGNMEKPLMFYDKKGQVVYLGTFSKILCPGLRIGWICASKELIEKYLMLKSSVDLSGATILQMVVSHYLDTKDIDKHISDIVDLYKRRRDVMLDMLNKYFPADVEYNVPRGGLFIWVTLPDGKSAGELLRRAVKRKVIFMPGEAFFPDREDERSFRLNFTNMSDANIAAGMEILGEITSDYLSRCYK